MIMLGYIYHITNKNNNKKYIGKTINLERRLEKHFSNLRNNKHHSTKLQRAFNKYGEDAFVVTYQIKEINNEEDLNLLEMEEIKNYDSFNNGYNETIGGDGQRTALDFNTMLLVYHITQRYKGVNRKIAEYFNCDHTIINSIQKSTLLSKVEKPSEENIKNLINKLNLQENNLNENYQPHNEKKLNEEKVCEILSIITQLEGYDKTICEIFNVDSKCLWRLKNNLIYKESVEKFHNLTQEEIKQLKIHTLLKYDVENMRAKRQRNGVKNSLTQEQVNYILDNQNKKSKAQIGRELNISADRVRNVINGVSYKDLVNNYYKFHNK